MDAPKYRRHDSRHAARPHRPRTRNRRPRLPGLSYQEEQAAKRMENPGTRGPIEDTAKPAAALAEKFEAARKKG
jgi:hypothetical protein